MVKQLQLIETLVNDKKQLAEQVETLTSQFRQQTAAFEVEKQQLQSLHKDELAKQKDQILVSEKIKRDKWEREKLTEIRARTVKGLEPEIQRLIDRNKDELRKANETHQEEIRALRF